MKRRLQAIFIAALAAFVALPVSAFSFSPPRQFVEVAAGKEQVFSFDIENETSRAARVHASVQAFSSGPNGTPIFTDSKVPTSIVPFVILSATDFPMKPSEHRAYTYTVKIPKTAKAGSYFGAIHFSFAANDGGVGTLATTGPLIFLNVPGEAPGNLVIASAQFPDHAVSSMPESIMVALRNDGSTVQIPSGDISVKNMFGVKVRSFAVNPDGAALLPQEERSFRAGDTVLEKNPLLRALANFALGPYTIDMHVHGADLVTHEMGPVRFWILPWNILGIAAVVALMLAMILGFLLPHHRSPV